MFWRKRPQHVALDAPSIQELASQLGVERRKNVRVSYPSGGAVCKLPEISFDNRPLKVENISVGGCCLLDPDELLGPSIGHDVELFMHWSTATEAVEARIVSRVDHHRHIQFLSLPAYRQQQLARSMAVGVRALGMRNHAIGADVAPSVAAAELWSSMLGDSVILENDVHRLAQIQLEGEQYVIFRQSWPTVNSRKQCSRPEFEELVLFLSNIPLPTRSLKSLIVELETLLRAGGGE